MPHVSRLVELEQTYRWSSLSALTAAVATAAAPLLQSIDSWLREQTPEADAVDLLMDDEEEEEGRKKRRMMNDVRDLVRDLASLSDSKSMIDLTGEGEEKRQQPTQPQPQQPQLTRSRTRSDAARAEGKEEADRAAGAAGASASSSSPASSPSTSTSSDLSAMEWILRYKQTLDEKSAAPSISPLAASAAVSSSSSPPLARSASAVQLPFPSLVYNCLLLLLELTFMDDDLQFRTQLFGSLRFLPHSPRLQQRLVAHFACQSPAAFMAHVTRLQHFLSVQLTNSMTINESTVGVTQLLSLLYSACSAARADDDRLLVSDLSVFHNEAVNSLVSLEEDYHAFITQQHVRQTQHRRITPEQELPHFTFFKHAAFLLNRQNKAALCHHHLASHWQPDQIQVAPHPSQQLTIHLSRARLVNDLLRQLHRAKTERGVAELRKPLHVVFTGEEGIDAGGLKKECLLLACDSLFDPSYGMFVWSEETRSFWFNAHCMASGAHDSEEEMLSEYELLGNVIGIALLNNVLLNLAFPPVVYRKLLQLPLGFLDLQASFPQLAASLQAILAYAEPQRMEDALCLTFSVDTPVLGSTHTHPLVPDGERLAVTRDNRQRYVELYTRYQLVDSVEPLFSAFAHGFWSVLPQSFLAACLTPEDLELQLCGVREMDWKALEAATLYAGFPVTAPKKSNRRRGQPSPPPPNPYQQPAPTPARPSHPVVKHLWSIIHSLSDAEQRQFLQFVTGSSGVPVKGLSDVRLIVSNGGNDVRMLPSSKTWSAQAAARALSRTALLCLRAAADACAALRCCCCQLLYARPAAVQDEGSAQGEAAHQPAASHWLRHEVKPLTFTAQSSASKTGQSRLRRSLVPSLVMYPQ